MRKVDTKPFESDVAPAVWCCVTVHSTHRWTSISHSA